MAGISSATAADPTSILQSLHKHHKHGCAGGQKANSSEASSATALLDSLLEPDDKSDSTTASNPLQATANPSKSTDSSIGSLLDALA
jgi:hypothetical protein